MNNDLCNPSESPGARPVSEDDFHTKQPHPCSLLGPSIEEQIEVIQDTIDILRDSFMDRFGPTKGQVTEPDVVEEIRCLEATLGILRTNGPSRNDQSRRAANDSYPRVWGATEQKTGLRNDRYSSSGASGTSPLSGRRSASIMPLATRCY